jgi:hypothetical protein
MAAHPPIGCSSASSYSASALQSSSSAIAGGEAICAVCGDVSFPLGKTRALKFTRSPEFANSIQSFLGSCQTALWGIGLLWMQSELAIGIGNWHHLQSHLFYNSPFLFRDFSDAH